MKSIRTLLIMVLLIAGLVIFPAFAPPFIVYLLTEILIFSLFATSYNLLLGYTGQLSFGHSAYFGLGAYASALLLIHYPYIPLPLAFLFGAIMAGVGAIIIGSFCIRKGGPYFAMLTLAFSQLIYAVALKWRTLTGGDDGMGGGARTVMDLFAFKVNLASMNGFYYLVLILVLVSLLICWQITRSPFGKILVAIRENQERTDFLGYKVGMHKLIAFIISGFFAGLAGAMFGSFQGFISPALISFKNSGDVLIMTFMGGTFSFFGPLLGAGILITLNELLSAIMTHWIILYGIVFIIFVLFAPQGIMGFNFFRGRNSEAKR